MDDSGQQLILKPELLTSSLVSPHAHNFNSYMPYPAYKPFVVSTSLSSAKFWRSELVFPIYFAAFSALVLVSYGVLQLRSVRKFISRLSAQVAVEDEEDGLTEPEAPQHTGIFSDIKLHANKMGGVTIFTYKLLRLFGCLILVGLTIVTLIVDEQERATGLIEVWKKRSKKGQWKSSSGFTKAEWQQVALGLFYVRYRNEY